MTPQTAMRAAPTPAQNGRPRIRVAVVDDHRMVLDGVAAHMRIGHPDIEIVATETSWIGLLNHPSYPVDVAVVDLSLGDAIPVETKIRTLATAGIRTVVMSRHADAISVQSAIGAGALAFVPKTDDACELATAIRAAHDGRRHRRAHTESIATIEETTPGLGRQELRTLMHFASGRSVRDIAELMGTTDETVKSYLKRARRKYRSAGIDLGTRALLRDHAVREGWLDTP